MRAERFSGSWLEVWRFPVLEEEVEFCGPES